MKDQPRFKNALGRLMGLAGKALRKRLDRNLAQAGYDLSAPQMILLKHIDLEDSVNQQKLTEHMFLDKTTMTRFIDCLEAKGLVVRVPDKNDRRQNMIYLTSEGHKILEPVEQIVIETEAQAIQGIDADKIAVCKEVLRHVRRNLEE